VIYGLAAALGWGLSDFAAAVSGRRVGAFATVVVSQVTSAALASVLVLVIAPDLGGIREVAPWLGPIAVLMTAGYYAFYRGLELAPVSVVSPVLASYAIGPVILAIALLGESLSPLVAGGIVLTIVGTVLASTDLRTFRTGVKHAPGLPWAIAASALFGIGAYVFGWASQRAGWLQAIWFSRSLSAGLFLVWALAASVRRRSAPGRRAGDRRASIRLSAAAVGLAAAIGAVDMLAASAYGRGSEVGYISIVTAASAIYPVLPVLAGTVFLHERPAPNQAVGVAILVAGLMAVGLG
jgi:drug/metabolite transporter (DMT)-like permease